MLTSYISTMIADPKGMLKGLVIIQHVILKGSNGTNEGLAVINVEKPGIVDVGINYIAILLNGFCRVNRKGFEDHRVPVSYTHLDVYKRQEQKTWKKYSRILLRF